MSHYLTKDQALGIFRALLAALGGAMVSRGWMLTETWDWLAGGLITAIPVVWSWFKNRP